MPRDLNASEPVVSDGRANGLERGTTVHNNAGAVAIQGDAGINTDAACSQRRQAVLCVADRCSIEFSSGLGDLDSGRTVQNRVPTETANTEAIALHTHQPAIDLELLKDNIG